MITRGEALIAGVLLITFDVARLLSSHAQTEGWSMLIGTALCVIVALDVALGVMLE